MHYWVVSLHHSPSGSERGDRDEEEEEEEDEYPSDRSPSDVDRISRRSSQLSESASNHSLESYDSNVSSLFVSDQCGFLVCSYLVLGVLLVVVGSNVVFGSKDIVLLSTHTCIA